MQQKEHSTIDRQLAFILLLICILISFLQKNPEIMDVSTAALP